ncbi:hypothetical protein ACOMICROBIO_FLGHMIGD_04260 [Vibrio sp. B1FLJ16]|uniref:DUF4112 domain-containing protein n=1 Tax=Vibrio sp. B1FLJ16 TaxID=2751178 RepID=UPI0015F4E195|nr:DUF4112 domain-containing protein [Vibrio sp. B1FLJ16]CAD7820880.1 hypothetical protein ACOMICROBIO_FLGHMIGD_04260 [Vibrio sp. B1FLJ16]CAE6944576.1 hypothetical protein ACOMICROBIO_FLGHMIGD_04260 [Vibrio sp. B1FLJ16]
MSEDSSEVATRKQLQRLAWVLDSSIRLPGGYRIGVDGIIGLIPGFGDALGAGLSSYIVIKAVSLNVPIIVLIRMMINVVLELVIGVIPIIGDMFDFMYKANERNVKLINEHLDSPHRTRRQSRYIVLVLLLVILGMIVLATVLVVSLLQYFGSLLTM